MEAKGANIFVFWCDTLRHGMPRFRRACPAPAWAKVEVFAYPSYRYSVVKEQRHRFLLSHIIMGYASSFFVLGQLSGAVFLFDGSHPARYRHRSWIRAKSEAADENLSNTWSPRQRGGNIFAWRPPRAPSPGFILRGSPVGAGFPCCDCGSDKLRAAAKWVGQLVARERERTGRDWGK
jgi:hypothetical protein